MKATFLSLVLASFSLAACAEPLKSQPLETQPDAPAASPGKGAGKSATSTTSTNEVVVATKDPDPTKPLPENTDPDTTPDDRPKPETTVRDCGFGGSKGVASFAYFEDDTKPVKLGMAVIQNKPITEVWATGTPKAHAAGDDALLKQEGDDMLAWDKYLGLRDRVSTFVPYYSYASELGAFESVTIPTATRLTHTFAMVRRSDSFELDPAQHAVDTPDDNGKYLSAVQGTRVFAYTLAIMNQNSCTVGALSDAVQKGATVTDMLAPKNREAVQKLLVRDGANLWFGVYSTHRDAEAASILFGTKCRVDNLAACQDTLDALAAVAAKQEKIAQPKYEDLIANKDENWAVTDFATADTSALK